MGAEGQASKVLSLCGEKIAGLCEKEGIDLVVLFGSHARGVERPTSDLDLAIQMEKGRSASKLHLIHGLEHTFYPHSVDLVVMTPLTAPLLLYEIFSAGKLVYEARPDVFSQAKLRAWKMYLDTAKLRRLEMQFLKNYVQRMKRVT